MAIVTKDQLEPKEGARGAFPPHQRLPAARRAFRRWGSRGQAVQHDGCFRRYADQGNRCALYRLLRRDKPACRIGKSLGLADSFVSLTQG